MDRAFGNMLNWLSSDMEGIWNKNHKAFEFEQAMMDCARIYSTNPCQLLGLTNCGFGKIADGAKADLSILDISGSQGNYKTEAKMTIVDGEIVYSKE
jgi:N-acetylglucosamine-6-phosphate deacetylase